MTVFGGDQTRPNIHIKDIANAYKHFLENPSIDSGCYNAGFENITIRKIAEMVSEIIPSDIEITESNDPRSYRQDSSKLIETGFSPKFTVLDAIKDIYNAYNKKELIEFKTLILEKIDRAQEDLEILRAATSNDSDNGTEDTSPSFKAFEEGSTTLSKEENIKLAERQAKFIRNLNNALIRIENNTYGICRVTGKLISKERLRLVPHATLSIEAKKSQ
mgnify:CR=1 FL=1